MLLKGLLYTLCTCSQSNDLPGTLRVYYRSVSESIYGSAAEKLKETSTLQGRYQVLHIQANDQKSHTVVVPSRDPEVFLIWVLGINIIIRYVMGLGKYHGGVFHYTMHASSSSLEISLLIKMIYYL